MFESLVAVGIMAAVAVSAVFVRLAAVERRLQKLSRLDAKLDALLKHSAIRFDPFGDVPRTVIDAVERGQKIEAIKQYRVATGAGLQEAKEFVEELQQRARAGG